MTCIFCKIVTGEISPHIIYQDDEIIAFDDVDPKAPQHVLIIPRKHIATTNDLSVTDANLIGKMVLCAKNIAQERNISEQGYRLIMNCNHDGGQAVFHIHLHLMGGRNMHWPPG